MKWKTTNLQTRLYIISAIILLIGLGSSLLINLRADETDMANVFGNQLEESKSYRRSLELYGGKANILASEFMHWFNGLWHGKALGFTLASITIFVCFGILLVAYNLPSETESDKPDKNDK